MKDKKELYNSTLITAFKLFGGDGKDTKREELLYRIATAALALTGAEIMVVLLRKNIQKQSIIIIAVALSCACFATISIASFAYLKDSPSEEMHTAGLIRGFIYAVLTLLATWQGIVKYRNASESSPYANGQSQLLSFLKKDNLSDYLLYYFIEPLFVILIGSIYVFYDVWGGAPIVFLGISVWIRELAYFLFLGNRVQQNVNQDNRKANDKPNHFSS